MSLQDKLRASQQLGHIDVNLWDQVLAQLLKLTNEYELQCKDSKYIAVNILRQLSSSPRKQLITSLTDRHIAIAAIVIATKYQNPNTWK